MRTLSIDFAPRTVRRALHRIGPLSWLFCAVGIVLCIGAALSVQTLLDRIAADQTALLRVQVKLSERAKRDRPQVRPIAISEDQVSAVNHAIAQLNLPWRDVFDTVEAATPKTIALLTLEPDAKRNLLKGMAEAKNSDDMIAYIEQLKKQAFFTSVLLTKHEVDEQDPNKPLRFQFEALWPEDAL